MRRNVRYPKGLPKATQYFLASKPSRPSRPHLTTSVKVENLSKATSQATLEEKLSWIGTVDVHLKECGPTHPANYAYVNCLHDSAQQVIGELDNKLLDGNLLRAKLKGSSAHAMPASAGYSTSGPARVHPVKDIAAVKVLIEGPHRFITGEPLDEYFSKYGEVTTRSIVRRGSPDYAYINFRNPLSAERCRSESPHTIQGVLVIAPGYNTFRGYSPTGVVHHSSNVANLASSEYTCDPLVVSYVERDAKHYFQACGHQVKVLAQHSKISLYAFTDGKGVTGEIEDFVKKSIGEHEAKVQSIDETLDCCYLPALVDPAVQKRIGEIQVPFKLLIKAEESKATIASCPAAQYSYSSLEELSQAYGKCNSKTVHADELKKYLSPAVELAEYRWCWEDNDSVFKPYEKALCKKLEQAYLLQLTIQKSIGKYVYAIDTVNKLQTNTTTRKKRKIKRELVDKSGKYVFSLRIRAHSDHIQEVKREILDKVEGIVKKTTFTIPYFNWDTSFVDHLLQAAKLGFVYAVKASESGNIITLRGVPDVVKQVEIQAKEEILVKQIESAKLKASFEGLNTPGYWEKQESKSELKEVPRGSAEWNIVEQHMKEPGFDVNIVRIERIQNLWQWEAYEYSRKRMSEKNHGIVNEKKLFHGCRETPPIKIYNSEQGFDNRLASKGYWGEGSYFAAKASYSDRYAHTTPERHKQMFLAHVLTGITYKCEKSHSMNRSLKAPPKKSERSQPASGAASVSSSEASLMFEDERYDSVSGVANGSEIFVIYEHGKVYPAYLVTYKHKPSHFPC